MSAFRPELPRLATRKALVRRVLLAALEPFVERANALAPVRQNDGVRVDHRLLHLNRSYVAGPTARLTKRQRSRVKREGRHDVAVHAGTSDPAGVQQEFGNRRHPAQPHARPAWAQTKEQVFGRVAEGMQKEVARAVARARRKAARLAARR
ncbi:HK97-gp10 family putative phage morphogenesis protein [Mangrovicoccus ximenensis]|uniref:hypothetical protein n=1 Tax=Mangrovicoccus ximenensis TaxID=1911570 RepID=UPI000D3C348B|nr:hypothetical protein [Mangrovicoccus ximenensis]